MKLLDRSPKATALLSMAVASALHFSAYEWSRSATIALFTSPMTGYQNDRAMPLATGCISPFSVLLLWMYTFILEKNGPRIALRWTSLLYAMSLAIGAVIMKCAQSADWSWSKLVSQVCIFSLFVSQNAFVQLLFTQHWAFLGSMGKDKMGAAWFAPVAGIGSLASTLAASAVGRLVDALTLEGLLGMAAGLIVLSALASELAYDTAEKNGFDPHQEHPADKAPGKVESDKSMSLISRTRELFTRVPILGVLCAEVVTCQFLSATMTFLFVRQVKQNVTNDAERAGWTGNCYAWINGASGLLQFFIIPLIVPYIDPCRLWAIMPLVMLVITVSMILDPTSLTLVAAGFCTLKILEYSLRGVCNEILFASLDFESRYVAKQEIGLLANRFSKSFTAVALFMLADADHLQMILSWTSTIMAALWLVASYQLTQMVVANEPTKEKIS